MYKLSIITINYNNLKGLKRTVESVVNQTWQEFEYIVIDGGSTDGSAAYIESQSSKIDYWVSESDKGIYNAMNKGIAKATGEYLFFLNSGDHFNSINALKNNIMCLQNEDIIYFDINLIDKGVSYVKRSPKELRFSYLIFETLPHQSTFIKRKLFTEIGYYDESIRIVSDWKFLIIAIIKHKVSYKYVEEVLTTFYLDGLSSLGDYSNERKEVLKDEFAVFIEDTNELNYLRMVVNNLRKSRKIKWLIKLGLLDQF